MNSIGAVCCYFNPFHYKSKLKNFEAFYKRFKRYKVDLVIVELAIGNDDYQLTKFPNVIRVRSRSILWHKERLLNIGIKQLLDAGYEKILWLDADIFTKDKNWIQKVSLKLDRVMLCQLFKDAAKFRNEKLAEKPFGGIVKVLKNKGEILPWPQSGLAWGARAELLKEVMLFDKGIVGGGDMYIFMGCLHHKLLRHHLEAQRFKHYFEGYSEEFVNHYKLWAECFGYIVDGKIDYVDSEIYSLAHGTKKRRNYNKRHKILTSNNYKPLHDIKLNSSGCFEWATNKVAMHTGIKEYFEGRQEDKNW